ncbi:hypothetical protein [Cupriavidus sp. H19C3]|uniref:hypothetical protein n=1 Tax=Cupriavidus sp. H19C3 TaxID=3241603 RepID=UPI003BF87AD8
MSFGSVYGNADGPSYLSSTPTSGMFEGLTVAQEAPVPVLLASSGGIMSDVMPSPDAEALRRATTEYDPAYPHVGPREENGQMPQITVGAKALPVNGCFGQSVAYDQFGQPLNGPSNFDWGTQFGQIWRSNDSLGTKLGRTWDLANYTVPDAQQRIAQMQPQLSVGAATLNNMVGSPFGAIGAGIARLAGASPERIYAASQTGAALEGIAGGVGGFQMPKAPQPGQAAAASRIRTRGNRSPVNALDVGKYGDLAPRSVGDGLSPDHIPSFAAVRTKVEGELGRPLTPTEATQLRNRTNTLVIGTDAHQEVSRTYGGRNTPAQIVKDASDLGAAARRDQAVMEPRLLKEGYTQQQIDEAFERLHRMNRADGLY